MSNKKRKMQNRQTSPDSKVNLITALLNLIIALINIIAIVKLRS